MDNLKPSHLSLMQRARCKQFLSSNAFYLLLCDDLTKKTPSSVVRMGDGERLLLDHIVDNKLLSEALDSEWRKRMGCLDIPNDVLLERLGIAGNSCKYFAPSIAGICWQHFELFDFFEPRDQYVDNFFVNAWSPQMIQYMYSLASKITLIHASVGLADAYQSRHGAKVQHVPLSTWQQTEDVIKRVSDQDCDLVLFSAGPGGKYIGPKIAESGKVVIDVGNAAEQWCV